MNNTWETVAQQNRELSGPNIDGDCSSSAPIVFEDFIPHPMVALIFRVDYTASIRLGTITHQKKFTVGHYVQMPSEEN